MNFPKTKRRIKTNNQTQKLKVKKLVRRLESLEN